MIGPKNKKKTILKTAGISLICVSILTGGIYTLSEKRGNNNIITTSETKKSYADKKKEIVDKVLDNEQVKPKQSILDKVIKGKSEEKTDSLFEQATSGNYQRLSREIITDDLVAFNEPKKEGGGEQQLVSVKPKEDLPIIDQDQLPVIPIEPTEPTEPIKPPYEDPAIPIVVVNYDDLESLVNNCSMIDKSLYLSSSLEDFNSEMFVSERILFERNATQRQVDRQVKRLEQSVEALILKGDKTALKRSIRKAERIDKELYTEDTYKQLEVAVQQGKEVMADDDVSQETVDHAKAAIEYAYNNLVKITETEEEKLKLNRLVTTAEMLQKEEYTETSWAAVEEALINANQVLVDEEATVEVIMSARTTLENAIHSLELKEDTNESEGNERQETELQEVISKEIPILSLENQDNQTAEQSEKVPSDEAMHADTDTNQSSSNQTAIDEEIQQVQRPFDDLIKQPQTDESEDSSQEQLGQLSVIDNLI